MGQKYKKSKSWKSRTVDGGARLTPEVPSHRAPLLHNHGHATRPPPGQVTIHSQLQINMAPLPRDSIVPKILGTMSLKYYNNTASF